MEGLLSIKDVIKDSILNSEAFNNTITLDTLIQIVISLLVSLILGLLIYYVYKKSYQGVVYSHTFAMTLVGMTVLICMVTLAISSNFVLSLGMVGALSIVRYRTAIKEPMDLLFLFWAISTGITVGADMYLLALISAGVVILLVILLGRKGISGYVYIMIIHYTGDDIGDEIRRIMRNIKYKIKSKTMRKETTEIAIEVYAKRDNVAFAEQIRGLRNVQDVTLVQYNGEYHG